MSEQLTASAKKSSRFFSEEWIFLHRKRASDSTRTAQEAAKAIARIHSQIANHKPDHKLKLTSLGPVLPICIIF